MDSNSPPMLKDATNPQKNRYRLEAELLKKLQQSQREWREATGEERVVAKERLRVALQVFNSVVLFNKYPDGGQKG